MRLSVCMITYNHEDFIEQAIASALGQDVNFEYEIVVGEDCSTDSTGERLRRLESLNRDRLKVIYQRPNLGSRANFLKTLSACTGEYIAFLEGDDFWTCRNKLQLQVDFLDRHPRASCVFHRTRALNEADPSSEYVMPSFDLPELCSLDVFLQEGNKPTALSSLVARRIGLADINTWLADIVPGDAPLCIMLANQGDVGFIPLEMSRYRVHPGGRWSQLGPHLNVALTIRMLRHVSSLIQGKAKDRVDLQISKLASWWSHSLVYDSSVSIDDRAQELNGIGDHRLSNYLLAQVSAVGRASVQIEKRRQEQSKAGQPAATRTATGAEG